MTPGRWQDPYARSVALYVDGALDPDRDAHGRPLLDDDLLVLINGWWQPLDFTVPPIGVRWRLGSDLANGLLGPS